MAWDNPHHRHHLFGEASTPTATPPYGGGESRSVSRINVNIDANMVVILAIFLCALLCAIGLNSFIRCALRCCINRHHLHHNHNHQEVGPPHETAYVGTLNRGLKRSTIRQIPTTIYQITTSVMSTDCMICLGEFMEGEKIKVLPKCKHGYHSKCIDTWLLCHSTCPTCRQSLSEWAGNNGIVVSMGIGNRMESSNNEARGGDDID